ncbi:MAG: integrase [Pseudomonadota bacterium]
MARTEGEFNVTQYLSGLARQLDEAGHGGRGQLIEQAAAFLGWSPQRLYAQLKRRVGWSSGRKTRADKGTTAQNHEALLKVATMQKNSVRKNGKVVLHLPVALSIAATNGAEIQVSRGRFGKLLRDRKLDIERQKLDRAVQPMRSPHPNYLHQVDPSLCLLYYLRGEQQMIRDDQLYKNKLPETARIEAKVWRYVLYDHASAVIVPWYVEARGESVDSLFQFLMHAWSRQSGRPFHGAPKYLLWDKGSANISHPVKNLLEALEVQDLTHAAGRARVKGGVENANNLVETQFESRLRFEPVSSVEELNRAAFAWANAWNANLIPHQDTRLQRDGLPGPVARFDLWSTIKSEELRILPDPEKCKMFLEGRRVTRKVSRALEIAYKHPLAEASQNYDLSGLDGVCADDTVEVSPLIYGEAEIMVRVPRYDGETLEYHVKPITYESRFGFRADAPVWGQDYRTQPDTEIERQGKALDRLAFPDKTAEEIAKAKDKNATPFNGEMRAHSHLLDVAVPPAVASRRGSEITIPDRAHPEPERLNVTGALVWILRTLNRQPTPEESAAIAREFAEGVTEEALRAWLTAREQRQAAEG